MRILRNITLVLAIAWSLALLPETALAQDATLTCNNGVPAGGNLFDLDSGPTDICDFTGWQHIFSFVICNFVGILDSVLSKVYCGLQYALVNILAAVITVYIAVFGVQILMGTTRLNAREILSRLLKIAFVWVFVTSAEWGIGRAFAFFLLLSTEGVTWVMSALPVVTSADPTSIAYAFCHDTDAAAAGGVVKAFTHLDEMICNAVFGPLSQARNEVIGFFVALGFILPPVFGLAVYWVWMNFTIMVRALVSFLLGISALAFLISLSPIFLSMMLFKSTYQFFENWLKYMISFSLQIIIIFACIVLWIKVTFYFVDFFNELAATVFPYQKIEQTGQAQQSKEDFSICPYNFTTPPGGPLVTCQNPNFDPVNNPAHKRQQIRVSALLMAEDVSGNPVNNTNYIFYVIYHLITLIIVAYAFDALMRDAPSIAVQLSGPQYTPLLGVGMGFNRYGQIMTRHSSADIKASKGFSLPDALQNIGGQASGGGASALAKTFRENIGRMLGGNRR